MPLKVELNAIKKNYVKLMKLPVSDLLPALKMNDVISDDQKEAMEVMTLDKQRAGYLMDTVIIPSLKLDIPEPFYSFLKVLEEEEDNLVLKAIADSLRSLLGPPMPQPHVGPPSGQIYPPGQASAPNQIYPPGQIYPPPSSYPPAPSGISQEKILNQNKGGGYIDEASFIDFKKSVCWIKGKSLGTGVIGRLKIKGGLQYVLLTCHHVIPTESDAKRAFFYFGHTDESKDPTDTPASNILDTSGQWFWTDPTYHDQDKRIMGLNYTMMKVDKAALDRITFSDKVMSMNIQGVQLAGDVRIGNGDNFHLISQTPSMNVASGQCTEFPSNAVVKYSITTSKQSSGGPVIKEDTNKPRLIAIHNGSTTKQNYGVRLSEILNHMEGKPSLPMPTDTSNYKLE